MHSVKKIFLGLALALFGCNDLSTDVVEVKQPIVTLIHVSSCSGIIPDAGSIDVFSGPSFTGACERWLGDLSGSGHAGYAIVANFSVRSFRMSPKFTAATVCSGAPNGPSYAPCAYNSPQPLQIASSAPNRSSLPWVPQTIVLGYWPLCPYVQDAYDVRAGRAPTYPALQYSTGVFPPPARWVSCNTTFDDSGIPAYVATDGNAAAHGPYGYQIILPTLNGNPGCVLDPSIVPVAAGAPAGLAFSVYQCP